MAATTTKIASPCAANSSKKLRQGVKVSDAEMTALNISGDAIPSRMKYTIAPRAPASM
jgi:hypothetical protein